MDLQEEPFYTEVSCMPEDMVDEFREAMGESLEELVTVVLEAAGNDHPARVREESASARRRCIEQMDALLYDFGISS